MDETETNSPHYGYDKPYPREVMRQHLMQDMSRELASAIMNNPAKATILAQAVRDAADVLVS